MGAVPGAFFWGWLADRIGRRKVFIATALNFSIATGLMALTPDHGGWIYLSVCRFFVGAGVSGLFAVDLPLVQEFVPTYKRGWVGGLVTSCLPLGNVLGALLGAFLEPVLGWRGLFLVGLLPAGLTLLIRAWVPESPRWLIGRGRIEEARRALAWALRMDPKDIELPTTLPEIPQTPWRELFRYPRSIAVSCLTSLSQTTGIGVLLWATTLFVLVLKISPAEASKLMIWVGLVGFAGRLAFSYLSDAIGRRPSGIIVGIGGAVTVALSGYLYDAYLGGVSVFFLLIAVGRFFRRRRLCGDRAVFGRGVAGRAARERHGIWLWRRQYRQDHRPARPGHDRRQFQLRLAQGGAGGARPGLRVSCLLVGAVGVRLLVFRVRNQRPLDRGDRPHAGRRGQGLLRQGAGGVAGRRSLSASAG